MRIKQNKQEKYIFIGKTLFFPKEKILTIGDLHLGYEEMLREQGMQIKINQLNETIAGLDKIFAFLSENKYDLKKIVLLGDVKHYFSFSVGELNYVNRFIEYLTKHVRLDNIIMIKGNHDTFNLANKKFVDCYIFHDIAFIHGHKAFPKIYDGSINYIIMSHIHPTITLFDRINVKREKYKCFLVGRNKGKKIVILPSLLPFVEGSNIEDIENNRNCDDDFSIIPLKKLFNFETYVVSDSELNVKKFGKLKDIK